MATKRFLGYYVVDTHLELLEIVDSPKNAMAYCKEHNKFYYFVGPGDWIVAAPPGVGPQGSQGEVGPAGADSTVPGPQGPAGNDGADSIVPGPQGPPGADSVVPGPPGANGSDGRSVQVFEQAGEPMSAVAGDVWIVSASDARIKKANGTWISIVGPQGEVGATGSTGSQGPQGATGAAGQDGAPGISLLSLPFHADGTANLALTNSPLAERFALNTPGRFIKWAPLGNFTQVRLRGNVITQSTSASSPRIRLLYNAGAYSTTLGNHSAIGASEVSISLTGTGEKDSGWINLVAGAKADCFIGLTELGGDGALDPALGYVQVYFK